MQPSTSHSTATTDSLSMTQVQEVCQGKEATAENDEEDTPQRVRKNFHVGQLVRVKPRTDPGFNREGGVGHITFITSVQGDENAGNKESPVLVNVRYVIGGRHDRNIDIADVQDHEGNQQQSRLRDRSMLLGRCRNCGSLRTDCGSCDVYGVTSRNQHKRKRGLGLASKQTTNSDDILKVVLNTSSSSSSSSSGESDDFEKMMREKRRRDRLYQRFKQRANQFFHGESSLVAMFGDPRKKTLATMGRDQSRQVHRPQSPRKTSKKLSRSRSGRNLVPHFQGDDSESSSEDDYIPLQYLIHSSQRDVYEDDVTSVSNRALSSPVDRQRRRRSSKTDTKSMTKKSRRYLRSQSLSPEHLSSDESGVLLVSSPGTVESSSEGTCSSIRSEGRNGENLSIDSDSSVESDDEDSSVDSIGMEDSPSAMDCEFIQPEGDGRALPTDLLDVSKGVAYDKLGDFFDSLLQRLESETIPKAQRKVEDLESQSKLATSKEQRELLSRKGYVKICPAFSTWARVISRFVFYATTEKLCIQCWFNL